MLGSLLSILGCVDENTVPYCRFGLCLGPAQGPGIGSQPSLANVQACPSTTGVADGTPSSALGCTPEGSCGYKLLGVEKYLSGFQKPVCGLAAAEAPGQDLPLAQPPGEDTGLVRIG